ncbi:hypothetical protein FM106_00240 [Brachybacterium faecium]|nr:hypothetical protein FM106_00240 [Brachybacterium faecium]
MRAGTRRLGTRRLGVRISGTRRLDGRRVTHGISSQCSLVLIRFAYYRGAP